MGTDEAGTLAAMQAHRNELWDPTIEKFGGRIVGTAGDSVLIEYTSAVAGVEAAIAVQRGMITRNGDLPDERRMMLRIGVNIGEVIVADEDIFGDGVNVAARLQALSDTGGIAISDNVHEQVRGRLEVAFSDDGEHEVKNIDRPVHVWRWSPTEQQAVTVTGIHGSDLDRSKLALPSIGELKFLIVDDEEFVRILITRILNNLGASNIDSADNGATALDRLDEMEGEADVILCDLNMPGMDGVEFLRHLSDRGFVGGLALMNDRGGRILDTAQTLAQAHKLNLFGSLEKPVMPQDLVELLEGYVANASRSKHIANAQVTEDELKRAIEADEMIVFFQPKVSVATGEVVGVESLIRWNHPESGIIAPGMFIPAAENYGLIDKLTDVVFLKSMVQGGHWWSEGHDMKISVNISVDSLHRLDLPEIVASQAMSQGLDPSAVILEVTESRLMTDLTASLEILTRIRMQDIGLSIDDFGTGFSSLEQLTRVPFNELKIDQAFVTGATNDPTARAILESSVDLARKLELTIVAEGVETQEDLDLIASLGVDIAQGYFIAKPTPAGDEFDLILQSLGERKIKGIAQPAQSRGAPIDSTRDNAESASTAKLAYGSEQSTTSALLDKPSIAVLPFDNMSDDPEQEYFADGMTEDIITGLSTWRWLPVIARNSTFTYKGQAVDVKRVGHDLGARYVLEGSVRKAGNRVRITGQLIDVESGAHVWAERYDRELVDIFDLQDEITESIVQNIMPEISQAEIERASRVPPANLDAWEYLQRGLWHAYRYTREDNEIAKEFLVGALERDPTLALAAAWRAGANLLDVLFVRLDRIPGGITIASPGILSPGNRTQCAGIPSTRDIGRDFTVSGPG